MRHIKDVVIDTAIACECVPDGLLQHMITGLYFSGQRISNSTFLKTFVKGLQLHYSRISIIRSFFSGPTFFHEY